MNKRYKTVTLDVLNEYSNTFNPLQALFARDEILILKNKYDFELNESLMLNPLVLYDGLRTSETEVTLIQTTNYKVIGNSKSEITIKFIGSEKNWDEAYELLNIVNTLKGVIKIQEELN